LEFSRKVLHRICGPNIQAGGGSQNYVSSMFSEGKGGVSGAQSSANRVPGDDERKKKMASLQQTVIASPRIERLRDFVAAISKLVESVPAEPELLRE
jgi:hypothetical protein